MIKPKLISIDTSIFGNIAKDYFSKNKQAAQKARQTISYLTDNGFIPFVCLHHIQEILQHKDDRVVFSRWSLIKRFPIIAWMSSYGDSRVLGSVFDIRKIEIMLTLNGLNSDSIGLKEEIKSKYIKYSTGDEFTDKFEETYQQIRDLRIGDIDRVKELESLTHIKDKEIESIKLSTLLDSQLLAPEVVSANMGRYKNDYEEKLSLQGDVSLLTTATLAEKFVQEVVEESKGLYTSNLSLYKAFIKHAGVREDQISLSTTVGELGNLGVYNKQVRLLLKSLGILKERESELIPAKQLSWLMWLHFDGLMKNENRAHGSNMQDKHMIPFSLIVDYFTVDKRVHEYFRQFFRNHPSYSEDNFGVVVKLSNYSKLVDLE